MELRDKLAGRLSIRAVKALVACPLPDVYALVFDADDRVGYNALWVISHFSAREKAGLAPYRNDLIDLLLRVSHVGRRRLLLALLEFVPFAEADLRTDYLDFCLSKINSVEPYGVRALCIKQAYAQCRFYPELLAELRCHLEMMEAETLSPGLKCVRRHIFKSLSS